MTASDRRRVAILTGVAALAAVVGIGLVLAIGRGNDGTATAGGGPEAVADVRADGAPLTFSGVDPITGEAVSLADFAGRPVLLNYWASWCPPCKEEIPAIVEFQRRHPEVAVVGVNFQDTPDGARELHRELGWSYPSIEDADGELGTTLGLLGMPTTFFLDSDHVVRSSVTGKTDLEGFEEGLAIATRGSGS